MVVTTKRDQTKAQFSKSLKAALDASDVPNAKDKRKRTGWLAKEFGVTYEAARKWLSGLSIPDQTHIAMIADRLRVDPARLHAGPNVESAHIGNDTFAMKLSGLWDALTDEVKGQIIGFALVHATTLPAAKKSGAQGRGTRTGT
jgi:hypothetical protein